MGESGSRASGIYVERTGCRLCGSPDLRPVIDFGTPFISDFLLPGEEGQRAPMHMVRCAACALIQTLHTVSRDVLFRDYWYQSGINETMVAALRDVVEDAQKYVHLDRDDAVLDIGSNDGTLLRQWPPTVDRYGVEPSDLWKHGLDAGPIFHGFFPETTPTDDVRFKVITSIAMFYAQDDPHAFVAAIKRVLAEDGVWVVQLQDLASVLRDRAFDYFCHEHLCLYSLHTFERLIHEHGLEVQHWETNDVNGGSLRIIVGHGDRVRYSPELEDSPAAWVDFETSIQGLKADTLGLLKRLKAMGKRCALWGASTKANTLLQFYDIGPELLEFASDRTEEKWGRRTVTGIPIVGEHHARGYKPDYYFLGPWHFTASYEARETVPGIVPLPTLHMIAPVEAVACL